MSTAFFRFFLPVSPLFAQHRKERRTELHFPENVLYLKQKFLFQGGFDFYGKEALPVVYCI